MQSHGWLPRSQYERNSPGKEESVIFQRSGILSGLQPTRNLTVFNGLATVTGGFETGDVPISGFLTPLSGPVTFDPGIVAYDEVMNDSPTIQIDLFGSRAPGEPPYRIRNY